LILPWALVLGCARPGLPKPEADAAGPTDSTLVSITAFDCMKHEVFPGEAPPRGPIPAGAGIRAWKGGGPYGASWNVSQLRCFVAAAPRCSRGRVMFTLRVGQQVVAEEAAAISAGRADFEAVLRMGAWQRGLDDPAVSADKLPFRTGIFRAQAVLDCDAPRAGLSDHGYAAVTSETHFVAGFASGE